MAGHRRPGGRARSGPGGCHRTARGCKSILQYLVEAAGSHQVCGVPLGAPTVNTLSDATRHQPALSGGGRPVVVVGAGPTGLIAASLLGHAGVPTLLVERNDSTSDEAKAISLDDETLGVLQPSSLDAGV